MAKKSKKLSPMAEAKAEKETLAVEKKEPKSEDAAEMSGETLDGAHETMEASMGNNGEGPDKWKIEDAANALLRAEEIKNDPKLLEAAKKQLAAKGAAIGKITSLDQLRAVAKKKLAEK